MKTLQTFFIVLCCSVGLFIAVSSKIDLSSAKAQNSQAVIEYTKMKSFESANRRDLDNQINSFLAELRSKKYKIISTDIAVGFKSFEVIGSRGSIPYYIAYIFYGPYVSKPN